MALPRLVDTALEGMGASLPPHISIQGNGFTLVDASGAEQQVTFVAQDGKSYKSPYLDGVIADIGGLSKQYYEGPWSPESKEPPTCFSDDGVMPSPMAASRQARTCAECPKNRRDSAVSKLSGSAIKACRDQKFFAFIPSAYPTMMFRYTLTPGSFKNWQAYVQKFNGQAFDIPDVVTRLAFAEGQNGVLTFEAAAHAPEQLKKAAEQARIEKKTDVFVGRGTQPALAAPIVQSAPQIVAPAASVVQTTPQPIPFAAAQESAGVAVSSPRRRRTKAEMEAAQNGAGPAPTAPQNAPQAPFRPNPAPTAPVAPPAAPAAPAAPFGIAQSVPPNPEMTAMLQNVFGKPAGGQ